MATKKAPAKKAPAKKVTVKKAAPKALKRGVPTTPDDGGRGGMPIVRGGPPK